MEEQFTIKASVEATLKQLEVHAVNMPSSMVWELHGLMLETATALLRACNSQQPFLRLPNEILSQIMGYIPDLREDNEENLRPVWRSAAVDTLMLLPISQTCHRLRAVALGDPFLWRHIHWSYFRSGAWHELMSRSGILPLTVVINASVLSLFFLDKMRPHAQEMHMVRMDKKTQVLHAFFEDPWPELQRLSLTHSEESAWNGDELISLSLAPRLRYLHLQYLSTFVCGAVPSLTHLSLSMLHLRECHARVAAFLSSCPNLVNATFDRMNHHTVPRAPLKAELPRLKHITFHDMTTPIIQFYLAVFSCPRPGLALQILSPGDVPLRQFPVGDLLPQYAQGGASFLAISGHLVRSWDSELVDDAEHELLLSMTAYNENNAFRICRPYDVLMQHLHRIVADKSSLRKLREVWIVNVPAWYSERLTGIISSVLTSLPALETLTVVLDHSHFPHARPNLRILPRRSDLSEGGSRLKTVRLVHGFSKHPRADQSEPSSNRVSVKLSLQKMLFQLLSREYDYLDALTLQTTPHFYIDGMELDEVAEHIRPAVSHGTIDVLPSMPLPDVCFEPASGSKAAFPASLW